MPKLGERGFVAAVAEEVPQEQSVVVVILQFAQHGSDEDVLRFLQQQNLHRVKLDRIAFRVQDKAFFGQTIPLLARRHLYDQTLWSYAVRHNEPAAIAEFLQHTDEFVNQCGAYLASPLLTIDPVLRKSYQAGAPICKWTNLGTIQTGEARPEDN
jgi:hypothetical protein